MDRYGIKASSIGSPVGKVKLTDDLDTHFEMFKRVVKTAKMLDAKYIRVFSFFHDGEEWTDAERETVLRELKKLIEYAKENGVVLLHENEKDIYGDIASRCLDLMKELYCDNFKAVFDPANFVQSNQDTKEAYDMLNEYVEYMHIKDSLSSDWSVVPASYGDGNVQYILKSLFEKGIVRYIDNKLYCEDKMIAEDMKPKIGKKYWGNSHEIVIDGFYNRNDYNAPKDIISTMNTMFAMYESAKHNGKKLQYERKKYCENDIQMVR